MMMAVAVLTVALTQGTWAVAQTPLLGTAILKYVEPLPYFAGIRVTNTDVTVTMEEFQQQILPASIYAALPPPYDGGTYVWGYNVGGLGAWYPGVTVEATCGVPTRMHYINNLPVSGSVVQQYVTVDQTLHWANPFGLDMMDPLRRDPYTGPPPTVVHLHGAEVQSDFDGGPEQWFTPDGMKGSGYRTSATGPIYANGAVYDYPNSQESATLWFHDHALGATRTNVYSGLAAFYLLRDATEAALNLPSGPYEVEFVIQDRMFDTNGQLLFPTTPQLNPEHPFWVPEFFGDVMLVNGKSWPYFDVEPRRYRFRFLDGCNARFLRMWLETIGAKKKAGPGPAFWQIGSDGGFLNTPVSMPTLLMGPGERADIIIDFSAFAGRTLLLRNDAPIPFPAGLAVNPLTDGQILQFRVGTVVTGGTDTSYNPATLTSLRATPIAPLAVAPTTVKRQMTLNENMGMPVVVGGVPFPGGPLEMLVNNTKWTGMRPDPMMGGMPMPIPGFQPDGQGNYLSELPKIGSTEVWEIINLTADTHPMHLHLVQFQLLSRQNANIVKYNKRYAASFPGGSVDPMTGLPYPAGVYIPGYGPPLDYNIANADAALGGNLAYSTYLQGKPTPPLPNETGWKDTVLMYPGEVTRIAVRWAQQAGTPYPFDATGLTQIAWDRDGALANGPGYVWHCHIIDHEDNEMMRPYMPVP